MGIVHASPARMSNKVDTAIRERDEWRARIMAALTELRGDDVAKRLSREAPANEPSRS